MPIRWLSKRLQDVTEVNKNPIKLLWRMLWLLTRGFSSKDYQKSYLNFINIDFPARHMSETNANGHYKKVTISHCPFFPSIFMNLVLEADRKEADDCQSYQAHQPKNLHKSKRFWDFIWKDILILKLFPKYSHKLGNSRDCFASHETTKLSSLRVYRGDMSPVTHFPRVSMILIVWIQDLLGVIGYSGNIQGLWSCGVWLMPWMCRWICVMDNEQY